MSSGNPAANGSTEAMQPRDWRYLLAASGAVLVLLSFILPMFPRRIVSGSALFSKGTTKQLEFPVLVSEMHFAMVMRPTNEELTEAHIQVAPAPWNGSGYAWLARVMTSGTGAKHLSFVICMLLPILSAGCSLWLAWYPLVRHRAPIEWLVAPNIHLAVVGALGLALGWLHQIDFSSRLQSLARESLAPSVGFWCGLVATGSLIVSALSMRKETERTVTTWWSLVLGVIVLAWLLTRFKPYPFYDIWLFIADGILVTLRLCLTSFGLILVVSLLGGLGRISKSPVIYGVSSLYVEVIRGIPLMVQLLFIWFALPQVFDSLGSTLIGLSPRLANVGRWLVDLRLDAFTAAVIGFTVCYGAYVSEIFRAGISSIHRGQMEAARSLGMNYFQAMRYIILPQAVRVILPPVGNEFVALLKDSSMVSVLAVSDLTRRGREYMSRTFLSFDTWIMVALCYLVLTLFSSRVVEYIESRSKFER